MSDDNSTLRNVKMVEATMSYVEGTALICGLAVFTILLAMMFNKIMEVVYKEKDNVDVSFHAGGKVSLGLTASTIVSKWTWSATLLQSTTVGVKYGISGPFWYAAGATVQILLFSAISVKLKILAPGAKTFVQFVRHRFGLGAHKVYCFYALMTNVIVTAMLMIGGAKIMTLLIGEYSMEMTIVMLVGAIGGYTMVGGLGATFYASYFNTATVFVAIIVFAYNIFINHSNNGLGGSMEQMFERISSLEGPSGNFNSSYLTFYSKGGLMFGIINIIGNFGTVFLDQAYWQGPVAAQPNDCVWGFLIGGIIWFAVPFTFATTMSMAYFSIQSQVLEPILSIEAINSGLVPLTVASYLGGGSGILVLIMILMAVTSTGAAEIIAVGSIIIYDIYMVYLRPFRTSEPSDACDLCGKSRGYKATSDDHCSCTNMSECTYCQQDTTENHLHAERACKPNYNCKTHGKYREYQDILADKKNLCLLLVTISIVPLTLIVNAANISLGWLYLFMGILIGSSVIPVSASMFTDYITPMAMIISPPLGTLVACIIWLAVAGSYPGGLRKFFENTGRDEPMLAGNLTSILVGGVSCLCISAFQGRTLSSMQRVETWHRTLDIDNPLYPWAETYTKEFNLPSSSDMDPRPALIDIVKKFNRVKYIAIFGGTGATVILLIVWPLINLTLKTFSLTTFTIWIWISITWAVIGGFTIIIIPVISETINLRNEYKSKRAPKSPDNSGQIKEEIKADKLGTNGQQITVVEASV